MTALPSTVSTVPPAVVALPAITLPDFRAHVQTVLKWVGWAVAFTPASWGLTALVNVATTIVNDDDAANFVLDGINNLRAEGLDMAGAEKAIVAYIKEDFDYVKPPVVTPPKTT